MNRRSLLLGSVVASVAGILGVKARPVEVAATPASERVTLVETWNSKGVKWEMLDAQGKLRVIRESRASMPYFFVPESPWVDFEVAKDALYNTPEYQELLDKYTWEQVDARAVYPEWRGERLAKVTEINHDDT